MNHYRRNVLPTVSVHAGRVCSPNPDDSEKCGRLVNYLDTKKNLHLTLRFYGLNIWIWYLDASFTVCRDFKSQPASVLLMSENGGAVTLDIIKQKLAASISTEEELMACYDVLKKVF